MLSLACSTIIEVLLLIVSPMEDYATLPPPTATGTNMRI
jgi:hypothetical protein